MNKLVVAYIGMGRAITQYHFPYVLEANNIEVKYVYRRKEDREIDSEIEKEYPQLTIVEDFDVILNDPAVHLVVVGTPNITHVEYAKKILDAGKNALIEKPFASTSEEAKELFELAKSKSLVIMPNQNRRFDGDFLTLKEVIERNVLGEIFEIELHYDYFKPNNPKTNQMIYLLGLGVHTIDQMIYLNGIPDKISYDVRSLYHPGQCDDYFDIDLYYGRKKKVKVKTTYFSKISAPRFIVNGSKGSLVLPQPGHQSTGNIKSDLSGDLVYVNDDGLECIEKVIIKKNDYGKIYDNLQGAILDNKPKVIQDEEVMAVLDILNEGMNRARQA